MRWVKYAAWLTALFIDLWLAYRILNKERTEQEKLDLTMVVGAFAVLILLMVLYIGGT